VLLLKLLYPAFCAGVEAQMRWGKQRADLLNTLDVLRQGVLVCDRSGRVLHRTPALTAMMALDPQADVLHGQMMAATDAVRRSAGEPIGSSSQPISSPVVEVRTGTARYILRASLYGGPPAGCTEYVLVSVDRRTPSPLSDAELREKFGLTPAETRVARLIAQGLSNDAISHELSISPYTARRHTERILQKMYIRSRAEVGVKLVA
jgi:DNA-binding CsgD family transcriptional regulator